MYIVTGAAGFIGGQILQALNAQGIDNILAVDDLTQGDKFLNLRDASIRDYVDHVAFRDAIRRGTSFGASAILHQGACSDTTESDGRYMLDNNYELSKELLAYALDRRIPFVYASSASVYGMTTRCVEHPDFERPLNVYAYSKLLFDQHVRRILDTAPSTVVGLRYFNVYGPGEAQKGRMASMIWQLLHQLRDTGVARLFQGTDGYADGDQRRDFVSVADVAKINLHFAQQPQARAIVNVGTGVSRSFNDIARTLIQRLGRGRIEYVPFPESLRGKYQSLTQADTTQLRAVGYTAPLLTLEQGIDHLIERLGIEHQPVHRAA